MKKITFLVCVMNLLILGINAQNIEVQGKAKITEMDTVTDISANVVRQSDGTLALRQYEIGDMAQGGIIFYIDESGEHGLVADTVDFFGTRWYAGTNGDTRAYGDGPFAGEMNTAIIISSQVAKGDDGDTYAARLCAELQKGGYGDWYLPSQEELNLMHKNLHDAGLGGFMDTLYWSSTEANSEFAISQNFFTGGQKDTSKATSTTVRVRAVRAFQLSRCKA